MARWRKKSLDEMTERIVQLGLSNCPVCGSGEMQVLRMPVMQSIGTVYHEEDRRNPDDKDHNALFMVQITCSLCGYAMHFDSERLLPGSEQALIVGLTPEEEAAMEADGP